MFADPCLEICCLANVVLAAIVYAFDQVDVVHRDGLPMLGVMPACAKPMARSLRLGFLAEAMIAPVAGERIGWPASRRLGEGWCPGWGSNPHIFWIRDFESRASASSATRAGQRGER